MGKKRELAFIGVIAVGSVGASSGLWAGRAEPELAPTRVAALGERGGPSFVNWEVPPVRPVEMTPDGSRLLVVNTAAERLEVFTLDDAGVPVHAGAVPVGLSPVAARARTNTEVWVANHISDSVSIVDLSTMNVVRTLRTLDEPCDIVFAGDPVRAFVTCSQVNTVQVFDPADLDAPPINLPITGEDPRALAVSPDGMTVYAAVFESGNGSTILGGGAIAGGNLAFPPNVVGSPGTPYGTVNPPPNNGTSFNPPRPPGQPAPPRVGLIVKKDASGAWRDDNGTDWTPWVSGPNAAASGRPVGWDLPDRDLAIISTSNLSVSYARRLMNICMAVGVNPATGAVTVVGTDAINEVRFEPIVNGIFVRVHMATVDPAAPGSPVVVDLNPHLDYSTPTLPQSERDRSIGDPRAIVWNSAGTKGYVAGMGSNNVIVIDPSGARAGLSETIEVGEGPAGLVLDEARGKLYVLNRFEASVSVVDLETETEEARVPFFDPTPQVIKVGRKHLYDTHKNSGLGHVACASCHVDARMDRLAWDLGDPSGPMMSLAGLNLGFGVPGLDVNSDLTPVPFAPFHPMKGPMTTQTLQDIIGKEPHHWRGDRQGLENFAGAFMGLQGDDETLTAQEMQEFEDFLATIHFPPNPFRNFDNSLPTDLPLPGHYNVPRYATAQFPAGAPLPNGNAVNGLALYRSSTRRLDSNAFACVTCHTLPTGLGPDSRLNAQGLYQPLPPGPMGQRHHGLVSVDGTTNVSTKVPQIRNVHEKAGFNTTQLENNAGFGYLHDGSVDSIERFVSEPVFRLNNVQELADMVAFMLCFSGSDLPQGSPSTPMEPPGTPSQDTHAAVGRQVTLRGPASPPADVALVGQMLALADAPNARVSVIAKGRMGGEQRGWAYLGGGVFQSDRAGETITAAALQAAAAPGSEITFTVVVAGTEVRLGVDHDLDGCLDRDELDGCGTACPADWNQDGAVTSSDISAFLTVWLQSLVDGTLAADFNADGHVSSNDISAFLTAWLEAVSGGC